MSDRQILRAVAVFAAGAALTGCGSHTVSVGNVGAEARVGPVLISDVHVVRPASGSYAADSSASVDLLLQNNGSERDHLDGATSPVAGQIDILLDGRAVPEVLLPPDKTITRGTQFRLVSLQRALSPGDSVPITLRFRRAGEVTVQAPLR